MKQLTFIVCFCLSLVMCHYIDAQDCPKFIRGDVNDDNVVTSADISYLAGWLNGWITTPPPVMDAADVNDDGLIQNADLNYLGNYLFQAGPQPPAPFPGIGYDCTSDNITNNCSPGDQGDHSLDHIYPLIVDDTKTDAHLALCEYGAEFAGQPLHTWDRSTFIAGGGNEVIFKWINCENPGNPNSCPGDCSHPNTISCAQLNYDVINFSTKAPSFSLKQLKTNPPVQNIDMTVAMTWDYGPNVPCLGPGSEPNRRSKFRIDFDLCKVKLTIESVTNPGTTKTIVYNWNYSKFTSTQVTFTGWNGNNPTYMVDYGPFQPPTQINPIVQTKDITSIVANRMTSMGLNPDHEWRFKAIEIGPWAAIFQKDQDDVGLQDGIVLVFNELVLKQKCGS